MFETRSTSPHSLGQFSINISTPPAERYTHLDGLPGFDLEHIPYTVPLSRQRNLNFNPLVFSTPVPRPITLEELAVIPDYTDIFKKFYLPQSLPADSQRSSPDLIPRLSLSDPSHSQPMPTTSDEFDTFKIYTDPDVSVILPRRTLERQELLRIITDIFRQGMQKKEQEHQKAMQEMEDTVKAREKEIMREAYRKGRTSALKVCNSPDFITMANLPPVKGVPGIPRYVIDTLEHTPYKPDPSESDVWTVPPYDKISSFLTGLVRDRGWKKKLLGRYDGKPVFVIVTGIVETHALDDGFFGKCNITWPDGKAMKAYCIGHFVCSGTALLLQEDDQLLAFTPEASLDEEWTGMNGSQGATPQIDSNGEVSVSGVQHLVVTSQAEW